MSTVLSLYVASVREFVRNRMTVFWTLAFPVLFIFLFGLIYSGNNSVNYTVGLVDQDNTSLSQGLIQAFKSYKPLTIKMGSLNSEQSALKKGDVDMIIVIPLGLQTTVSDKQTANVQMIYDPSRNATDAAIKLSIVQGLITGFNKAAQPTVDALALQTQSVQTKPIGNMDLLVPGILAMALMQLGLFGTATPLVALRQQQVLRRLGATPLPRWQVMVSQIMLRMTIGLVQTALIVGVGATVFGVVVQGNMLALLGVVAVGAAAFIGLGYFIASVTSTVEGVNGITSALNFPMMFLSGIFIPLTFLPAFLKPVIYAIPVTYLADAVRQVMVNSTPQFPMMLDLLVLAGWAIVTGLLSVRFFKWE